MNRSRSPKGDFVNNYMNKIDGVNDVKNSIIKKTKLDVEKELERNYKNIQNLSPADIIEKCINLTIKKMSDNMNPLFEAINNNKIDLKEKNNFFDLSKFKETIDRSYDENLDIIIKKLYEN